MRPHTATAEGPHGIEDPPQPKINIKKKKETDGDTASLQKQYSH